MRYFPNRIICKSTPDNFSKEKSGLKNNTVREVWEEEFKNLNTFITGVPSSRMVWWWPCVDRRSKIVIENTETWESFERYISDITQYKRYEDQSWEVLQWVYVYIISFCDTHPHDAKECAWDERADSERYVFWMDLWCDDGDESVMVIAKKHSNGSIEIVDTKNI